MRRVAKRTANTQEEKACPRMNLPSRKTKDSYFPRKGFSVRMGKTQTNLGNAYYRLPIGESCRQFAEGHRGLPGSPAGLHRGGFPTIGHGARPPSAVSGRNYLSLDRAGCKTGHEMPLQEKEDKDDRNGHQNRASHQIAIAYSILSDVIVHSYRQRPHFPGGGKG